MISSKITKKKKITLLEFLIQQEGVIILTKEMMTFKKEIKIINMIKVIRMQRYNNSIKIKIKFMIKQKKINLE